MPISTTIVGTVGATVEETVEPRWAMNFAAAIDDYDPARYATDLGPLSVHPMYLGFLEWEATKLLVAAMDLSESERARGVASGTNITMHRPLRTGMHLSTHATIVGVEQRRGGTAIYKNIETHTDGELVASTIQRSIFRDVQLESAERAGEVSPPSPAAELEPEATEHIQLRPNACHVFSECARAYNPIHTDIAAARTAGLSGLILHGSATLAIAASVIGRKHAGGDITRIGRIVGDFQAMVYVPSTISVRVGAAIPNGTAQAVPFDVRTEDGKPGIAHGEVLVLP